MSYQVLARKWRPQNFKQMVGQEHVLKALIHALESQRLHHAYLFTGTRGVGKTTIGRILAKCLSCDKGITAEPCGQCSACTSIVEGRYVDLIEIDAASRTKVEDMRELLENVQYAPSEGRFKIYLIDEVHMLSSSSFNALLKTLEEPPEHVKFLFATTDPQKLPVTILSRCLQFNLKNMSPERIVSHLQYILAEEQVSFEDMALWALARAADGSMRDALSLTDQAIAYGNHSLTEVGVSTMLGTVDQKKIYRILDCLIDRKASEMLLEIKALAEFSPNYASVLATVAEILHRVAIEQAVPGAIDNSMGDREQVVAYASRLCAEDVQLFYQVALVSRQDLAITPDPKSGLEMALLRMLAFQLSPSDQSAAAIAPPVHDAHMDVDHSMMGEPPVMPEPPVATEPFSAPPEQSFSNSADDLDAAKKKTLLNPDAEAGSLAENSIESSSSDVQSLCEETVSESQDPDSSVIAQAPIEQEAVERKPEELSPELPASANLSSAETRGADLAPSQLNAMTSPRGPVAQEKTHESSAESDSEFVDSDVGTVSHAESVVLTETNSQGAGQSSKDDSHQDLAVAEDVTSTDGSGDAGAVLTVESSGWNRQVTELGLSGMTLNLLINSVLEEDAAVLKVYFESGHYRLLNANHEKRIREALTVKLANGRQLELIEGLAPHHETPMMWRERVRAQMIAEAKVSIQKDPFVQQMIREFDGMLIENSIQSLGQVS